MSLRINTNVEAFNAHRNLAMTNDALAKSMEKLSSGFRINRAGDDAAGLGISERMRGQISGTAQAVRNTQDGISLVQTAEGSLTEFHSILHRIRDLAVQYNNGVYSTSDKAAITAEVAQLSAEIDRMLGSATFNGIPLLSGVAGSVMTTLQIGANSGSSEQLAITAIAVPSLLTSAAVNGALNSFATNNGSTTVVIASFDAMIDAISSARSTLGSIQNRLEHTINFLSNYQENMMSAESRVRDVDMASEMTNFTRLQILQQSGTAMLSQANQAPQSVLSLLK